MNATERSIIGQFDFWDNAPDHPLRADPARPQIVVGCGTSYNLAMSVAAAMTLRGLRALAVPGSEWAFRPRAVLADETGAVIVALSRSGESTETVEAARRSRARGLTVIGITCAPGSSLTHESDVILAAGTHPEEGIVMTASASLMTLMAFRYAGYDIPPGASREAARVMRALDDGLPRVLQGRTHFVVLGSGPLYGTALEGALKLQEMSISYTQAFHPMEYRHGPISLLDERTVVVVLYSAELQIGRGAAGARDAAERCARDRHRRPGRSVDPARPAGGGARAAVPAGAADPRRADRASPQHQLAGAAPPDQGRARRRLNHPTNSR